MRQKIISVLSQSGIRDFVGIITQEIKVDKWDGMLTV